MNDEERKGKIRKAAEEVTKKFDKTLRALKEVEDLEKEGWNTIEAYIIVKERRNEDEG